MKRHLSDFKTNFLEKKQNKNGRVMTLMRILLVFCTRTPIICKKMQQRLLDTKKYFQMKEHNSITGVDSDLEINN